MILDKAKMAHDYAIEMLKRGDPERSIAFDAWVLADTMQAEADKRAVKLPHVFFDAKQNEEWQPDWSQAPDGYNWWAFDGLSKGANWYNSKPWLDDDSEVEDEWNADLVSFLIAPSFNYAGNWQESLRKRPQ